MRIVGLLFGLLVAVVAAGACSRRGAGPREAATPGSVETGLPGGAVGSGGVDSAPGPLPPVGPARTLEPPSPLPGAEADVSEAVEFVTGDGVTIHAGLWKTGDPAAPAVVFVHQRGSDRSEWDPFVRDLRARAPGIALLAIDLRGHGASTRAGEATLRWEDLQGGDTSGLRKWAGCTTDVQAAVEYLRGRGEGAVPRTIGLVGSSIGATSVLRAAAADGVAGPGRIAAVVALSPGMSYFNVPIRPSLETLKVRGMPVLLVGARDDTNDVAGTAQQMQEILAENLEVRLYDDGGHGVAVAAAHAEAVTVVVDFLKARLGT